jgi:hypothetical protein
VAVEVLPEHRPTLPELLGARARWVMWGLGLLVGVLLALSLVKSAAGEVEVVRRSPVEFNFRHSPEFKTVEPTGDEVVRVAQQRNGKLIQAFAVSPLALPEYSGDVGGVLPTVAEAVIGNLRESVDSFELVQEGKARINDAAGYGIVYRGRFDGTRRLYGRVVLLPEPLPGARRGVELSITATPAAGVGRAEDVGARGLTKKPFRSFRFGLEGP